MSVFDKLEKSIKNKLTLQDINTSTHQKVNTVIPQKVNPKKTKLTIYLNDESIAMLNEICSKNILENGKQDKSALMDRAIKLLYDQERKKK